MRTPGKQLLARLGFARTDLEPLVRIDNDHDGLVSAKEMMAAKPHLEALAGKAIRITVDGRPVTAHTVAVKLDGEDRLRFDLSFPYAMGSEVGVHASIIPELARGHRQYVSLADGQGRTHTGLLSGHRSSLSFNLEHAVWWRQFGDYLREGVWHIWIGLDHILFLMALLLPAALVNQAGRWRARESFKSTAIEVIKIVSAFTVAHSITLSLSVFGVVSFPGRLVESMIAASVIIAAFNNLFPKVKNKLWALAFGFGLLHGMGFASVLAELGLPQGGRFLALAGFNIGVELGQLAVVAVALPAIFALREWRYYRPALVQAGSWAIMGISTVWLVERVSVAEVIPWI